MEKTNVMRILDKAKVPYVAREYDNTVTDGETVARLLGQEADRVFKTLVTVGNDRSYYVFVLPVNGTLNLKKAAASVGVKSVAMIKLKELFPLTGYVHGGCSPIGMKKTFVTVFDETALICDTIMFSGGRVGAQVELKSEDIKAILKFEYADLL